MGRNCGEEGFQCQSLLIVAKHHSAVPRNDVVANFVGFIPTVFREGDEVDISFSPSDCVLLGEDDRRLV